MSKTGDAIAAGVLVASIDAAQQNAELRSISAAMESLKNAQASEAARRAAIEQLREQVVSLRAEQDKAGRALETTDEAAIKAASYLVIDAKETLDMLSSTSFPDISDKEYLRSLQADNATLVVRIEDKIGKPALQELHRKVISRNLYEEVAIRACASGTLAQNRNPPLSWLFWWNSHLRYRWNQFGLVTAQEMAQTGRISMASMITGYVVLLARLTVFPFIPALLIALIYGSLFGGYWWSGLDTARMTFKLWPVFSIGIPLTSLVYRRTRWDAIREWATQTDIDPEKWLHIVRRTSPKALRQGLREDQPELTAKLSRIGIAWPSGLKPGTPAEVEFLEQTRVVIKRLAGHDQQ